MATSRTRFLVTTGRWLLLCALVAVAATSIYYRREKVRN
jgi:hypothetical protein